MERPLTEHIRPRDEEPMTLKEYEKVGGYQAVRKALKMSSKDVQQEVIHWSSAQFRYRRFTW